MDELRTIDLQYNRVTDLSPLGGYLPDLQTGVSFNARHQSIDLGTLDIGVPAPLPTVLDTVGGSIDLDVDPRDNGNGTFTPTGAPGVAAPLVWNAAVPISPSGRNIVISGEFTFTQAVATDDPMIDSIAPDAEFTTCNAPTGASGTGEPDAHLYVTLWEYPNGHGTTPMVIVEEVEVDVETDGTWSAVFATELDAASYSVAADQRVSGTPDGLTEVEFTVTAANCDTGDTGDAGDAGDGGAGDAGDGGAGDSGDAGDGGVGDAGDAGDGDAGDAVQDQDSLADTGVSPLGGVLGAGGLLLAAGAALFLARRRFIAKQ